MVNLPQRINSSLLLFERDRGDPALHPHLQRGDDVLLRKPEFEEGGERKADHDRGAADDRHRVFGAWGDFLAHRRDETLLALPTRIALIHRHIEGEIVTLRARPCRSGAPGSSP